MTGIWRPCESDPSSLDRLAGSLEPLLAGRDHPELEHDVRWLAGLVDGERSASVWVHEERGVLRGYAPFFVHPSSLDYRLGEVTLFSWPCRRYVLTAEPIITGPESGHPDRIADLFEAVARALPDDALVFLQGVRTQSVFHAAILGHPRIRALFRAVPLAPPRPHRLIHLDGDFEAYLSGLGKATRKDLRRTIKRVQESRLEIRTRRFGALEDVEPLLRDVESVSRKTYQWHLLGEGVAASPLQRHRLSHAARLGILRSYILYLGDRPIAFRVGYAYRGTYFSQNVGFDPEFAKLQIGIYLFTETIADLSSEPGITRYDFLYGDAPHKERLSNAARSEQHLYLVPKTLKRTIAALLFQGINSASTTAGKLLEGWGLKQRIKKLLRRRAVTQPPDADELL
jgi:CelD/BcsL family acetyltransferase involved in cellulose biosynthesis